MVLQSTLLISIFVFLSSLQFCQVKGQCTDQSGVIQNNMTCVDLGPVECYDATVRSKCCHSCTTSYTGVTGCEYGDRVANCIVVLCTFYTDPSECCNTCKPATTAATSLPSTTTTTTTTQQPTIATTTATTTTQPAIATTTATTTPQPTIATTTTTTTQKTATITSVLSTTSSLQVPAAPSVSIVTQTTRNITLNVILQAGSTANEFEVKATTGVARNMSLPAGTFSVDYVFSAPNDAGTCFTLEIVAINTAGRSAVTTVSKACYAPKNPEVTIVTQTTSNVTLTITLPAGSLGNTFEVKTTGGGSARSVPIPVGGSRSIQYVFDTVADAGTCFILEVVTLVTNNTITSDKITVSNVCYAPKKPEVTVVAQTTSNITLTITLPMGSLGNNFEVNVQGGGTIWFVPLALGTSRSVQHMFNEVAEAGTCFNLEIVARVSNNSVKSDKTTVTNACYAPKKPEVNIVAQATSNVTLTITLPTGSLGNTFEVKVTGGGTSKYVPLSVGGSRSVQHVFNEVAEAGTCFSLEIVTVVTNNPMKSDATTVTNACYAPKSPEITVVTQTTSNVTLNITLPVASLGGTFEVKVTGGGMVRSVSLLVGGSRSVQYVFDELAEAGTCFSLEVVNLVTNNPIKSDKMNITNVCYAPQSPEINVVTQTTSNVTLNITLPVTSLGSTFEVKVTGGGIVQSVSLPVGGSKSVQYVFNEVAEAGTCFSLEIVNLVTNNPIKSDTKNLTSACYAPKKLEVNVITQTTTNVTLIITLPIGSLGTTFEVKVTGGGTFRSVPLIVGGSRSLQHVFNEVAEAGTCFSLEIVTLVTNNPIKSDTTTVTNACYAPKSPEVIVVTQTISNVTLNITLPAASLGNTFEVRVIGGGMVRSVPLPFVGARSVQYVFNEIAEAGTCFSLEFVNLVTNNPIKSDKTNPTNACYEPKKPEVNVVTQSTRNITMNITLPAGSLGNTFEVKVAGGVTSRSMPLLVGGSRSVQHVFNEVAEAGTCFSLETVTLVNNNPIKSDTTTITSSCYVPLKPTTNISEQTMNYITFKIALQAGSTGKSFIVNVIGGKEYVIGIPEGSTYVKFVFNETGIPGACFTLQVKTVSFRNLTQSEASTLPNTCYAPMTPEVYVVETTMKSITLNISISYGSSAKSFQISRSGDTKKIVDLPPGTTSALYVFDNPTDAGTCFTFEIVGIAADDRARSKTFAINSTCYASFPVPPGSLSAEEQMIVGVSSVGGIIFACGAAAVLIAIVMKRKRALSNRTDSPRRRHRNHRLISHYYGNPRIIPDYFGTDYPTHNHSYNQQRYNLDPNTNNENIQDYNVYSSQLYNWGQWTPFKTFKTYR